MPKNEHGKIHEILRLHKESILELASKKLARPLTPEEKAGVLKIDSLMMLESVEQTFAHPSTSGSQIAADLEHFSKQAHS